MAIAKKSVKRKMSKRRFKRRVVRRKYGGDGVKTQVFVGRGMPLRMIAKHRYCETLSLTSTAGAFAAYNFVLNGIYDPNAGGAGHQPMCFDQFQNLYDHWIVLGCKATVTFHGIETNTQPMRVGAYQNDDTVLASTNMDGVREQNLSKIYTIGSGGDSQRTMTFFYSAKKRYGSGYLNNTSLHGDAGTNPAEKTFLSICYQTADGATNGTVVVSVVLDYIVQWREPKDLNQS